MNRSRAYSVKEEKANAISHGLGILLGVAAVYILLNKAYESDSWWSIASVCVYLAGMLSSYISSTWYHACTDSERKSVLRKFDHSAIYLHIAGTLTPFLLILLRGEGVLIWVLFGFIWLAALAGVVLSFRNIKKHSNLKTFCYVLMGCSIFVAFKPLISILSELDKIDSLYWLLAGGTSYIIGTMFYSYTKKEFMHTVFHLFVLGGSICHIIAIYKIL